MIAKSSNFVNMVARVITNCIFTPKSQCRSQVQEATSNLDTKSLLHQKYKLWAIKRRNW